MQSMLEAYVKSQKNAGKSKKCKRHDNDSVTVATVNRKLGTATRGLDLV
jgi:hypothetical protein